MTLAIGWLLLGLGIAVAVGAVALVRWLLTRMWNRRWPIAGPLVQRCTMPAYVAAVISVCNLGLPPLLPEGLHGIAQRVLAMAMIGGLTWLLVAVAYALTDQLLQHITNGDAAATRRARRLETQVKLLRRVTTVGIVILAVAAMLFTFPSVQTLGAGLLASAGLIGIVAGVAAQSTLGNLFAGLQLAFSDAMRLGDTVVVNGELGTVEELSLTNVVLRIWDERRMVLPVSYFTTTPFENWTKHGTQLTGTVFLRVDWEAPVREIRGAVGEFVEQHPLWDGRNWSLVVTDVLDNGMVELRVLVTAADSDAAWDLRCAVREFLIDHLREQHPESLPRNRTEFELTNLELEQGGAGEDVRRPGHDAARG
ncbi:mechanosensitive ion channel family protein [Allonocardiopsis opalescens]|uniref:Small-conductance mechanosensitive channel n=1 Tax=Allonocardiopsis opalescens TaxID=1144618 RepID=A0A2T0PPU3_9ACTN|nr:mechanosensitive ion channel domain-containing protein [Allonocardiopsis opalescens]PRX90919.1 small-conductance mechanosensitive channel [Allonocardiopsis opalescens]